MLSGLVDSGVMLSRPKCLCSDFTETTTNKRKTNKPTPDLSPTHARTHTPDSGAPAHREAQTHSHVLG